MGQDPQKVNNTDQTASPFDHWFGPRADADSAAAAAAARSVRQIIEHDPDLGPMHVTPTCPAPAPVPQRPASDPVAPPEAPSEAEAPGAPDSGPQGPPDQPLAGALTMAARGFRVFPLSPGTKIPPKGLKWKTEATTDAATIRNWAATYPGCNFAVRGGQGLIVLDPDGDAGRAALAELETLHGRLPNTMTVQTPGGGKHIYLGGADVSNSAGSLPKGIDVRGAGGYVVAPGSYFADPGGEKGYTGHYRIETDLPVADAPEWLPGLLKAAPMPKEKADARPVYELDQHDDIDRATRFLRNEATPAIEGKGGDQQTYAVACEVRDFGISEDVACELMLEHYNLRCSPPWGPDGMAAKVANAFAYAQNHAGSKSVAAEAAAFASAAPLDDTPAAKAALPAGPSPLVRRIVRPGEERLPLRWAIKEMLPRTGAAMMVAPPGAGKSTALLDLAAHLSRGEAWFGRKVTERRASVILAFEGAGSIGHRLDALQRPDEAALAIEVWDVAGVSPTGLQTLTPMLAEADARFRESHGFGVGLVAVDTLSASGLLTEENSNAEAAAAVRAVSELAGTVGALGFLNHHPPKNGRGPRGGGAFLGNVDTLLWIEREDKAEERELILDKSRDGREGSLGRFKLRTVELGTDDDGDPITACAIERTGDGPVPSSKAPPKWLEQLLDAFEHVGEKHKLRLGGQVCIPENHAREIFDDRVTPHFKSGGQRKAWSDALKFATSTGQLRVAERVPHCWILNRDPGLRSDEEAEE